MTNYLFLAEGFEEVEALATVDVLRRSGIEVKTVSISSERIVTGSHGIAVGADLLFDDGDFFGAGFLILPGGLPGATNLGACDKLTTLLKAHYEKGGSVAAICAAPMVLGKLGILNGREAICYPGFEQYMEGAKVSSGPVAVDGRVITGKGPAYAYAFGLAIAEAIAGKDVAEATARGMLL